MQRGRAVRPDANGVVIVDAMDHQLMVEPADQPGLREVADDAAAKLHAAIDALSKAAPAN